MTVFVINSPKGRKVAKRISQIIECSSLIEGNLKFSGCDFVICSSAVNYIDSKDLITVFTDDVIKYPEQLNCSTILMSSCHLKNFNNNIEVITYGHNAKDTITFSSIQRDEVVVSLQRELKIGLEPCEIVVKINENLDYDCILAICGVIMLMGKSDLLYKATI